VGEGAGFWQMLATGRDGALVQAAHKKTGFFFAFSPLCVL
jgi:hypothetical protein